MKVEKYALESGTDLNVFEFVSEGPKGSIRKIIYFQMIYEWGLYNLAFGDKDPTTGEMDDLAVSNNGDREKVLATVVTALYTFFERHPDAYVYAKGSTAARTRLYRMGITKYYNEMVADFQLFGEVDEAFYKFEIGKNYDGFLAMRKFT